MIQRNADDKPSPGGLAELERQQELLRARLREGPPTIVRLHPRLAEIYAERVQQLEMSLNNSAIREEAAEVLRSLIDRIELRPRGDGKGVDAELHGDLAEILAFCDGSDGKSPKTAVSGSQLSVVAGTRNQRCLHLDHAILVGHPISPRGLENRCMGNRTVGSNPTLSVLTWLCISGCGEFSVSAYTLAYAGDALAQVSRTSKSLQTAIVETRE